MDDDLRVRRLPEMQTTDRDALFALLDEALIAHVGVVRAGRPLVVPFACARDGDDLLLHGSTGAGGLGLAAAQPVCVSVTHLDGLLFARSLFHSSMHYRSAVILGDAETLLGAAKREALDLLSDHLMPGRVAEVRASSKKELAATLVLRLSLDRASVKISEGPADDPLDGESREVWAGVVPLRLTAGDPIPADAASVALGAPPSAVAASRRGRDLDE